MAYYILKSYRLKGLDPFKVFEALSNRKNCFFLDTSLKCYYPQLGRYSILGAEPFLVLKTDNLDIFKNLREILNRYKIKNAPLPFFGGAVGYISYDLGLNLEKRIKKIDKPDIGIPDCFFGFYNTAVIIDHLKQLVYLCSVGFPEEKSYLAKRLAKENFKKLSNIFSKVSYQDNLREKASSYDASACLESNFSKEGYICAVKKAKEYIKAGDIYQVNLSQQFKTKTFLSSLQLYQRLREISPSYFSAYLDAGEFQILSSSPERFLKLEANKVITRPMKGTRPRGKTKAQDLALRKELLNSEKDKAELVMIVDLERNDLGKVCSYNSIRVTNLRELEEYRTVFQTTATIEGRLHHTKDRIDLLRACSPGGSITGCPKIRAMEIIEELEPSRRSIYTGNLGYLSFSGDMDFNILIRTILKKDKILYFGAGGGIVADSDPQAEYEETIVKAKAMVEAINVLSSKK